MISITRVLVFVPSVLAFVIKNRGDVTSLIDDVINIDDKNRYLADQTNLYAGGLSGALPVNDAQKAVDAAINQATANTPTTNLTPDQYDQVNDQINILYRSLEEALSALKNKKPLFDEAGVTPIVKQALGQIKSDSDDFADKIILIAPLDKVIDAGASRDRFDGEFQSAIDFYNGGSRK